MSYYTGWYMLELFFFLTWILKIAISKTKPYPQMATSSAASPQPWKLERLLFYHRSVQRRSGTLYSGGLSQLTNPQVFMSTETWGMESPCGFLCSGSPWASPGRTLGWPWQWVTSTLLTLKSSCICCLWHAAAIKLRLKGQSPYVEGASDAGVTEQSGWPCPPSLSETAMRICMLTTLLLLTYPHSRSHPCLHRWFSVSHRLVTLCALEPGSSQP